MKKINQLSKAEMKKIFGGVAAQQVLCTASCEGRESASCEGTCTATDNVGCTGTDKDGNKVTVKCSDMKVIGSLS